MLLSSTSILLTAAIVAVCVYFNHKRKWNYRLRGHRLPPGPRGWPMIGSLLDVPTERPWTVYREWAYKYGDMLMYEVLGTPILIISSADIAFELLDKRSSIYSDRPPTVIDEMQVPITPGPSNHRLVPMIMYPTHDFCRTGWDFNMGNMRYGSRWRSVRRMFHQHFNQSVAPNYRDKQRKEIHAFLRRCLDQPSGKPLDPAHVRLTLATIIMDIVYGYQIQSMDDEHLKIISESMEVFASSQVYGKYWVNFLPILKRVPAWVPGAEAVKFGEKWRPVVQEMVNGPFDEIKRQMSNSTAIPSMTVELITETSNVKGRDERAEQEQYAKEASAIAYAAGSDTTYSILQTFFCCMAMYPEIQKKAKEELDLVVGPDRLPTYEDSDSLPYIQAILMECARWLHPGPLGIPHRATTDDYYKGYLIPEGTVILTNVWHILRNPREYPEPERFNPDRFMKDGAINPEVRDPNTIGFGFGRRVCPGRYLAKDNAFMTFASVLHVFDVVPALDSNGKQLDPTIQMTTGILSYPDKLNYTLRPRSGAAERLIRSTGV